MIEIRNDLASIRILPELGGKISSLIDHRTGRDWLWTNPHLPRRPPVYGESYIEGIDTGGWDEIFPSISPCQLPGNIMIPDHGDLVFLPAEVREQTSTSLVVESLTRAIRTRFTRKLSLENNQLTVDYTIESLDDRSIPYLWAAHPLIALEDGMELELPTTRLNTTEGLDLKPMSGGACRIAICDPALGKVSPHSLKFFTEREQAEQAIVHARDGSSLRIAWSSLDAPYFGVWLNQRNWSGIGSEPYFNMGIEPTTAACDSLTEAISTGDQVVLAPGEVRSWSIRVFLESSRSAG